jgi:hypothetical protein
MALTIHQKPLQQGVALFAPSAPLPCRQRRPAACLSAAPELGRCWRGLQAASFWCRIFSAPRGRGRANLGKRDVPKQPRQWSCHVSPGQREHPGWSSALACAQLVPKQVSRQQSLNRLSLMGSASGFVGYRFAAPPRFLRPPARQAWAKAPRAAPECGRPRGCLPAAAAAGRALCAGRRAAAGRLLHFLRS